MNPAFAHRDMSVGEMELLIEHGPPGKFPDGWGGWEVTRQAHVNLIHRNLASQKPYPQYDDSACVVSCVSAKPGHSSGKYLAQGYFPAAWVMVNELRRHGCNLPVYFCHLGDLEWDRSLTRLVAPLGVTVIDLERESLADRPRILAGWESKVYSIEKAPHRHVIYLDADNIPLANPERLLSSQQYRYHGACFWPDVPPQDRAEWLPEACWLNMGMPVMDVTAGESGQLMIDKKACWKELMLCRWLNEHSDYVYQWLFGDKDTFIMAWQKVAHSEGVGIRYAMPSRMPAGNGSSLIQYAFDGQAMFQHCTRNKATMQGFPAPGSILSRKECLGHIDDLCSRWSGRLWQNDSPSPEELQAEADVKSGVWTYERVGLGERPMRFLEDHRIGRGMAKCETDWSVWVDGDESLLAISDIDGAPTCILRRRGKDEWAGRWLRYEQCDVILRRDQGVNEKHAVLVQCAAERSAAGECHRG